MPPVALALALAAALIHASWNLLVARSEDPQSATALAAVASVVLPLPLVLATWDATPAVLWFAVASGALELAYLVLLAAAYRRSELSLVYPLARGLAPVLVLAAGVLVLGVAHSAAQIAGVGLVAVGVVLVRGFRGGAPLSHVVLALAIACCIAGYTTLDKTGVTHAGPVTYYELVMGWPAVLYLGGLTAARGVSRVRRELRPATLVAGVGMFGAYAMALAALQLAPAASVAAVRETSVVMATAMSAVLLREAVGPRRLAGAALVAVGVAALALG